MDTSRPVVLVHGAWHGAWAWEPLLPALRARGMEPVTVELPSARGAGDLHDDAAVVRAALRASDAPTVLVGHSYGGMPVTEGGAGLPQVTRLVYVCAFQLDVGQSVMDAGAGRPSWNEADRATGLMRVTDPVGAFYGGVEPALAADWSRRLGRQTITSFTQPLTAAAWHDVPSTYVVATQDAAIPVAAQRAMAAHATTVVELDSAHSPFATQPEAVADVIAGG